jgi:hypothetical protein
MDASVIDHQQAIEKLMAERYLLDELGPQERDAFEAHLFECVECFEQVRAGTEFVHYVKRIGAEEAAVKPQKQPFWRGMLGGLRQPVAAFASVLLFLAVGLNVYQQRQLSRQKEPRLERSYILTGIAHGGDSAKLIEVPPGAVLGLTVEYAQRGELTSYGVRILSASGTVQSDLPVPRDQVDGMARITVSTDVFKPGRYSVVVWGRNNDGVESEVGRGAFELQFTR